MGVSMTPRETSPLLKLVMALAIVLLAPARGLADDQLILAWVGQSELGYLRVELRSPDPKEPKLARLVIKSAATVSVMVHTGQLVAIPTDMSLGAKVHQLFIASPADIEKYASYGPTVLAAIGIDGGLRLYTAGTYQFRERPELKPLGSAE